MYIVVISFQSFVQAGVIYPGVELLNWSFVTKTDFFRYESSKLFINMAMKG